MTMSSSRPYIIRSLYEWILDNDSTPYILVDAFGVAVEVPQEHVKDGQIILNISPNAVRNLNISNDALEFNGRFAGIPTRVFVPIISVIGIYAKENGQGMFFDTDSPLPDPSGPRPDKKVIERPEPGKGGKQNPRPNLRVVK